MKPICDFCAYQTKKKHSENVTCDFAYFDIDEYGKHKRGCRCVHDSDLSDAFKPRTEADINVRNMAAQIERQSVELMKAREEIRRYKERLVKIDE